MIEQHLEKKSKLFNYELGYHSGVREGQGTRKEDVSLLVFLEAPN